MQEDFFDESASAEIETSGGSPAVASVSWKAGKHKIENLPKEVANQVRMANEGLAGFSQYNKDANPQNTLTGSRLRASAISRLLPGSAKTTGTLSATSRTIPRTPARNH